MSSEEVTIKPPSKSKQDSLIDLHLPAKILVVEDEKSIQMLLRATFKKCETVLVASDGSEGLELIKSEKPDFVVTDINMPNMDGLEMITRARQLAAGAGIPIMVLTSGGNENVLLDAFIAGADDFMVKPFSTSELRIRVASIHMRQKLACDVNPLTKLPGNTALKHEIDKILDQEMKWAIAYFDLDHFKEFNDTQGFERGDKVIALLGDLMRDYESSNESEGVFIGHVGGDDFVMLLPEERAEAMAQLLTQQFKEAVEGLYTPQEIERGTVVALNRKGEEEEIEILSVSIAIALTSRPGMVDVARVAHVAAELKKKAKNLPGNSYFIDRRKAPVDLV